MARPSKDKPKQGAAPSGDGSPITVTLPLMYETKRTMRFGLSEEGLDIPINTLYLNKTHCPDDAVEVTLNITFKKGKVV